MRIMFIADLWDEDGSCGTYMVHGSHDDATLVAFSNDVHEIVQGFARDYEWDASDVVSLLVERGWGISGYVAVVKFRI